MSQSDLILVTGAAGRLGSRVVAQLCAAGHRVRATDLVDSPGIEGVEWIVDNLSGTPDTAALLAGVTRVAHLGNHASNYGSGFTPAEVFNDNVSANMNVFHAAMEVRVRRIVFASSIQVIAGESMNCGVDGRSPVRPARLPLDASTPADPGNTYGWSKVVGEETLAYLCRNHGLSGCALRLPHLIFDLPDLRHAAVFKPIQVAHAFTWLSYDDATDLIIAALFADIPGYRVYLPASPVPCSGAGVAGAIARHYADVPWREGAPRTSLVDLSALRTDFAWTPRDWSPRPSSANLPTSIP